MKFGSEKKYERLLEAYGNGDVSRRDMMRLLTVAAAAVGVVGGPFGKLTREALAAVEQVRFDGWAASSPRPSIISPSRRSRKRPASRWWKASSATPKNS